MKFITFANFNITENIKGCTFLNKQRLTWASLLNGYVYKIYIMSKN